MRLKGRRLRSLRDEIREQSVREVEQLDSRYNVDGFEHPVVTAITVGTASEGDELRDGLAPGVPTNS